MIGRRIVVTGPAGAGKSTFSRKLSARTVVPLIHLDLAFWKPGWTKPTAEEWLVTQRQLLAGDEWIADGNYADTLATRLERADTVVFLDTPWWLCAWRATRRGLRRPPDTVLPDGCEETRLLRLRAEWRLVPILWRKRRSERDEERAIILQYGAHATLHVLRSKRAVQQFLDAVET